MRRVGVATTAALAFSLGGTEVATAEPQYAETCTADVRTADDDKARKTANIDYTVYHEKGHAAQDAAGQQFFLEFSEWSANRRNEQQADCVAGRTAQAESPDDILPAATLIGRIITAGDRRGGSHGTSAQRQVVFLQGAVGENCGYAALQSNRFIPKLSPEVPPIQVQATYAEPQ